MKKIIILIIFISILIADIASYKEGFKDGWESGYKEIKGQYSFVPFCPFPPYPKYNQDTYKHGYNRGFIAGMKYAKTGQYEY